MNGHTARYAFAAVLWTGAVALGIVGSVNDDVRLMFWAVMASLVAVTISVHLIVCAAVVSERIRVEGLVDGVIARARERADLPRLR